MKLGGMYGWERLSVWEPIKSGCDLYNIYGVKEAVLRTSCFMVSPR